MASNVNDIITASDLGNTGGALIPTQYANQIIQNAPATSSIFMHATPVPLSSRQRTQPVLSALPYAYWVNGDTGLKQTTKQQWENLTITAEEMAAIVPIPEALINDSAIPLWPEIMPRLGAALGSLLDKAALFGVNKPASFPTGLVPGAIAAGNYVVHDTSGKSDLAAEVATLGKKLAGEGFAANAFCAEPGFNWQLVGLRDSTGRPIYVPSLAESAPSTLYGYPFHEATNGAWDSSKATFLGADWSKVVYGVRQDITYKLLDQAVITDDDGKVILNLAQQDSVALRVVFRVGFQIANPVTELESDKTKRFPAAVIVPTKPTEG